MSGQKKSLGQHWLADDKTLAEIAAAADLKPGETVLEIGPGTGTLTWHLMLSGAHVIAVEKDEALAAKLPPAKNLQVVAGDILKFDLTKLPPGYKVVANIPYYLTSNLFRVLSESANPPAAMVLLVQKEVAERVCAGPGDMSVLAVSAQLDYTCRLGKVVPASMFEPPPRVDSQVVILNRRPKPLFDDVDKRKYLQVVKAGFSARRKKLRSSLAGGLGISRAAAEHMLQHAQVDGDRRAQELSLAEWHRLSKF